MGIYSEQNEKENGMDIKDNTFESLQESVNSIQDFKTRVSTLTKKQQQLSDKILHLSIGNGMKQNDKETIMILLVSIVKQLNGQKQ